MPFWRPGTCQAINQVLSWRHCNTNALTKHIIFLEQDVWCLTTQTTAWWLHQKCTIEFTNSPPLSFCFHLRVNRTVLVSKYYVVVRFISGKLSCEIFQAYLAISSVKIIYMIHKKYPPPIREKRTPRFMFPMGKSYSWGKVQLCETSDVCLLYNLPLPTYLLPLFHPPQPSMPAPVGQCELTTVV